MKQKQKRGCEAPIMYSIWVFVTFKKKAYFWIISVLEASNLYQIANFCILTNFLNSISERFGPIFEQINISPKATTIMVACILIYYLDKALPMA